METESKNGVPPILPEPKDDVPTKPLLKVLTEDEKETRVREATGQNKISTKIKTAIKIPTRLAYFNMDVVILLATLLVGTLYLPSGSNSVLVTVTATTSIVQDIKEILLYGVFYILAIILNLAIGKGLLAEQLQQLKQKLKDSLYEFFDKQREDIDWKTGMTIIGDKKKN